MSGSVETKKTPLLAIKNLKKHFKIKGSLFKKDSVVKAVNEVSINLYEGETYGLVGESGSGKSTLGRTILKLIEPTSGEVFYQNKNILDLQEKEFRKVRKDIQMVFQDPYSSLNPRQRIGQILEEPLIIHSIGDREKRVNIVMDILKKVGLQTVHYYRFPHELSGGQRQRIGLARSLIVHPKLIITDEPVSALDVSIQSQIINLLRKLQNEMNIAYLFIAHDISVVRHISDRIGVMYLGNIVEESLTDELFHSPLHPYTEALLSVVPIPDPSIKRERVILKGELPSPLNLPKGCPFSNRCPKVMDICTQKKPKLKEVEPSHRVACHLYN